METIFKLKASELDRNFIESVKNLFKNREIEISIKPSEDETEYLLKSPANKKYLHKAIEAVKKNENLISFNGDEFEELSKKMLST
jgi:antitoxin YefM